MLSIGFLLVAASCRRVALIDLGHTGASSRVGESMNPKIDVVKVCHIVTKAHIVSGLLPERLIWANVQGGVVITEIRSIWLTRNISRTDEETTSLARTQNRSNNS